MSTGMTTVCNTTLEEFSDISIDDLAYGCATIVFEKEGQKFSRSFFGSDFDQHVYHFTPECEVKVGNLSDKALTGFIEQGQAIRDERYGEPTVDPFGFGAATDKQIAEGTPDPLLIPIHVSAEGFKYDDTKTDWHVDLPPLDPVVCATTGEVFEPFAIDQAQGCATTVFDQDGIKFSISHYGSEYDTQRFVFSDDSDVKAGNLCDKALREALKNGQAVQDETFEYWNTFNPSVAIPASEYTDDVVCATTGEDFEGFSKNQAFGCACFVQEQNGVKYVTCHFGSTFDMSKYILSADSPVNLGNLSDKALEIEIKAGRAQQDTDYNATINWV